MSHSTWCSGFWLQCPSPVVESGIAREVSEGMGKRRATVMGVKRRHLEWEWSSTQKRAGRKLWRGEPGSNGGFGELKWHKAVDQLITPPALFLTFSIYLCPFLTPLTLSLHSDGVSEKLTKPPSPTVLRGVTNTQHVSCSTEATVVASTSCLCQREALCEEQHLWVDQKIN